MGKKIRKTGIDILGDVPWGSHFCQFYKTKEDLIDILVPYFKAGLENNEFCMWIISEPLSKKEAEKAMRKAIPNFDRDLKRGHIEIVPYEEWYLREGTFNLQIVLNAWIDKLDQALAQGYDGLRVTGNTAWLEKRDWRNFTEYEEKINNVIGKYRMMAICTYSLDKCGASEVIDVVSNHQLALIRREGKWELIESSERKRAEEELRESEGKYRSLFDNMHEGFAYCKIIVDKNNKPVDFEYIEVNDAFEMLTGLKKEHVTGKRATEAIPGIKKTHPGLFKIYGKVALTGKATNFKIYFEPLKIWLSISVYCPKRGYFAAIFDNITEQKKAEERLKASLKEKEVLLREIHHRVKNNLQIITSLLKLQSQHIEDKRYVEMCKDSQDRIRSMSLIHEMLYQSKHLSKINFKEYIRTLTNYLFRSCWPSPHRKIALKIESENVYLAIDNAIPCGLIINELVSNSLKHAFPDGKEGQIKIGLRSINEEDVELVVSDDGVGIPEDLDIKSTKSLGLHLVTILAEDQLHGEIKLDRNKGTEFQIKLRGVK